MVHYFRTSTISDLKLALIVFASFVAVHLLLLLGTYDIYDLEETEYGNVAVAMLDRQVGVTDYGDLRTDPNEGDALMSGAGRRRRTIWSVEPTVAPFFALLGTSMLSLKIWALCGGGLWAAIWFLVARRVTPRAPPWAVAALFVLPIPLVQRAAISATSITAHLGSSVWHGLALLLALMALARREGSPGPRAGLLVASGLVAGWGLHCGFSLAPLLLGVVFVAWRAAPLWGVPTWAAGTVPGLAVLWTFRDTSRAGDVDLITRLTGLSEGSTVRAEVADTVVGALLYWPGIANFHVTPTSFYDPVACATYGVGMLAVVAAGLAFGRRRKRDGETLPAEADTTAARIACWLSFVAFFGAMVQAGMVLDAGFFDGLRYLLPLAPAAGLVAAGAASRLPPRTGAIVVAILLAGNGVGFAMVFSPTVFPAPWASLAGYEPVVMKAWMTGPPADGLEADHARRARWSTWAGTSAARRGPEEAASAETPGGGSVDPVAWRRGLGVGLALAHTGDEPWTFGGDAALLEGAAWGTAYAGCSAPTRKALLAAHPEHAAAVWYGIGRADLYCRNYEGPMAEEVPAEHRAAFEQGLRDAWAIDYARPGTEPLPELRPRVRIY